MSAHSATSITEIALRNAIESNIINGDYPTALRRYTGHVIAGLPITSAHTYKWVAVLLREFKRRKELEIVCIKAEFCEDINDAIRADMHANLCLVEAQRFRFRKARDHMHLANHYRPVDDLNGVVSDQITDAKRYMYRFGFAKALQVLRMANAIICARPTDIRLEVIRQLNWWMMIIAALARKRETSLTYAKYVCGKQLPYGIQASDPKESRRKLALLILRYQRTPVIRDLLVPAALVYDQLH